jgi:hypothetical protein
MSKEDHGQLIKNYVRRVAELPTSDIADYLKQNQILAFFLVFYFLSLSFTGIPLYKLNNSQTVYNQSLTNFITLCCINYTSSDCIYIYIYILVDMMNIQIQDLTFYLIDVLRLFSVLYVSTSSQERNESCLYIEGYS